jgi:hypothetical protein
MWLSLLHFIKFDFMNGAFAVTTNIRSEKAAMSIASVVAYLIRKMLSRD